MIKIAHESPKGIFKEVQKFTDYDYALVHLFEEDKEYWNQFKEAALKGREIILDNSIFELEEAFDAKKFDQLNNFPEYKYNNEKINKSVNSENSYSSKDYGEFNKIIKTKNKKEEAINNQNKKVKIIDYGKLKESEKKLKNKLGIEKIKVVYFD